ncbi:MAG: PleD family two-component system response regulator, partial [Pseudomonadota bacterium]
MSARILVVDDIQANRRLLQAKLEARYFQVFMASSGPEALQSVKENTPDIVLLDINMPGMDGYEVARRLKEDPSTAFIPIVMVTALSQQEDRLKGLQAGADDFITKPFDDFSLMSRINALLRYNSVAGELRQREATAADSGLDAVAEAAEMARPSRVVIVDSNQRTADRMATYLRKAGHAVTTLQESGGKIASGGIDVMVLSLARQTFDPLKICAQFQMGERTRSIAILVVCDDTTRDKAVQALELGASDIIDGPVDKQELLARVLTQTRRTRYIEILRRRVDRGIELSIIDPLTGLYNRRYMMNQITQLMQRSAIAGVSDSVVALDIDHFKSVNDTYGHDVGDRVLQEFARRLRENVRPMDIVCRHGGEEFIVIMPETAGDLACVVAERIRRSVAGAPFDLLTNGETLDVTVSAGVASADSGRGSVDDLLRRADDALYLAKKSGRNRVESIAA